MASEPLRRNVDDPRWREFWAGVDRTVERDFPMSNEDVLNRVNYVLDCADIPQFVWELVSDLAAELREARKDTERLDWLERMGMIMTENGNTVILFRRTEIDDAMQSAREEEDR